VMITQSGEELKLVGGCGELSCSRSNYFLGESLLIKLTALKGLLYPYEVRILCP